MKKICRISILLISAAMLLVSCASAKIDLRTERKEPAKEAYYDYILGYEEELSGDWDNALQHYDKALKHDAGSGYLKTRISYI